MLISNFVNRQSSIANRPLFIVSGQTALVQASPIDNGPLAIDD